MTTRVSIDEAALRSLITNLEQHLSSLERWLHFWSILVIVGCACELFFVVQSYSDHRKLWLTSKTRGLKLPERPSLALLILEVLSVALVVIGISGELEIDRISGDLQAQLRSANNSLFLLLEREAGDAKASSETAAKASEHAVSSAETAKSTADSAVISAGRAKGTADKARTETDSVSKEAEALVKELASAKQNISTLGPRSRLLIPYNHDFNLALKPYKDQKVILVTAKDIPAETTELLSLLGSDFIDDKWTILQKEVPQMTTTLLIISIAPNASDRTRQAAISLATALSDVGLIEKNRARLVETSTDLPDDCVELIIGKHF